LVSAAAVAVDGCSAAGLQATIARRRMRIKVRMRER
jgi:hypothetical protein